MGSPETTFKIEQRKGERNTMRNVQCENIVVIDVEVGDGDVKRRRRRRKHKMNENKNVKFPSKIE